MKMNRWSVIMLLICIFGTVATFSSCSKEDEAQGIDTPSGGGTQTGNDYGSIGKNDITATGDAKGITYLGATMLGTINNTLLLGQDFRVYFLVSDKYKTESDLVYENTRSGDSTRLEVKHLKNDKLEYRCSCFDPNTQYFYRTCIKIGNQYYYGDVKKFATNDLTKAVNISITSIDEVTPYSAKIYFDDKSDPIAVKEIIDEGFMSFNISDDPDFGWESVVISIDYPDNEKYIEISGLEPDKTYTCQLFYYLYKERYNLSEGTFTTKSDTGNREVAKAVDLGLSVKWADRNVGAFSEECTGTFFAFGETEGKEEYTLENYKWKEASIGQYYWNVDFITKNLVDENNILKPEYDAATANWGSGWSMPTKEQAEELFENCMIEDYEYKGVDGVKFTGPNGNSIFVPSRSFRSIKELETPDYYWKSSFIGGGEIVNNVLYFGYNAAFYWQYPYSCEYYVGLPIRPVYK